MVLTRMADQELLVAEAEAATMLEMAESVEQES